MICPGFASDCVETLEEINIQGRESFIEKGGKNFDLIPCLNDNPEHIKLFEKLVSKYFIILKTTIVKGNIKEIKTILKTNKIF